MLNPLCFYHANAVCSLPVDAYYYRMRSQSVSHHVDNQKRIIESLLEGLESHSDYMKEHPAPVYTIYDGYTFGWILLVVIGKRKAGSFAGRGRL